MALHKPFSFLLTLGLFGAGLTPSAQATPMGPALEQAEQPFKEMFETGKALSTIRTSVGEALYQLAPLRKELAQVERELSELDSDQSYEREVLLQHRAKLQESLYAQSVNNLEPLIVKVSEIQENNLAKLQDYLDHSPAAERQLVADLTLKKRSPTTTLVLFQLALVRLQDRLYELYAEGLIGSVEINLESVERDLRLIDGLFGTDNGSSRLDQLWDGLLGEGDQKEAAEAVFEDELLQLLDNR